MGVLGWLQRLFSAPPPLNEHPTTLPLPSAPPRQLPVTMDGWGYIAAVGESQYQHALHRAARSGRICWATLLPEPDNPFDGNAVVVQIGGQTVGYLSRNDARRYQKRLLALPEPMQVAAKLIGGERGKPSFGVLLDCREVEALPKPKPVRRKKVVVDPADQPF